MWPLGFLPTGGFGGGIDSNLDRLINMLLLGQMGLSPWTGRPVIGAGQNLGGMGSGRDASGLIDLMLRLQDQRLKLGRELGFFGGLASGLTGGFGISKGWK